MVYFTRIPCIIDENDAKNTKTTLTVFFKGFSKLDFSPHFLMLNMVMQIGAVLQYSNMKYISDYFVLLCNHIVDME